MGEIDGEGTVNYGHNVEITYFAQNQAESLDTTRTVYETVDAVAEGEIRKELRTVLGTFLFSGEDVDKQVGVLSGGERTRLALCQLLLSPSNFLILDEPTNHLDIQSKEVLKEALKNYQGTFVVVSHDREFLEGLTNRIWDIEDKTLKVHHFDVKEFLKRKMSSDQVDMKGQKSTGSRPVVKEEEEKPAPAESTLSFEEKKELKRRKNQLNNQVKKAEDQIADLEKRIAEMDAQMLNLDYSDEATSSRLLAEYETLKNQLDEQMQLWEAVTEELMGIEVE